MDFLNELSAMANKKGGYNMESKAENPLISEIHQLLMEIKISHYSASARDFEHQALGETYDAVGKFADEISEKLMGYCGSRVSEMTLAPCCACPAIEIGGKIIALGDKISAYGKAHSYSDLENIGQSFSGAGAQLRYLVG
jgi:hypothetical protein